MIWFVVTLGLLMLLGAGIKLVRLGRQDFRPIEVTPATTAVAMLIQFGLWAWAAVLVYSA